MSSDLASIRQSYDLDSLSEQTILRDPFAQFSKWLSEAIDTKCNEPTAMTLSTVDGNGLPNSRVVLLKGFDHRGAVFFTNYGSRKGRALTDKTAACVNFFWPELQRQVNIIGNVTRTSREESEEYFLSRPLESRISAWASEQSSPIASRSVLESRVAEFTEKFGDDVPLPPFWGGFRISPTRFEFWQGRADRLHDRLSFEMDASKKWQISRLAP